MCDEYTKVKEKPLSESQIYEYVTKQLAIGTDVPIVGRDTEKQELTDLINMGLDNGGHKGVIYVHGQPGTGKTKCVTEVCSYVVK